MAAQPLYQVAGTVPDGSTDCLASGVWRLGDVLFDRSTAPAPRAKESRRKLTSVKLSLTIEPEKQTIMISFIMRWILSSAKTHTLAVDELAFFLLNDA